MNINLISTSNTNIIYLKILAAHQLEIMPSRKHYTYWCPTFVSLLSFCRMVSKIILLQSRVVTNNVDSAGGLCFIITYTIIIHRYGTQWKFMKGYTQIQFILEIFNFI